MRVLDSAIGLGQLVDRPVTLVWLRNEGLNCSFGELFERPAQVQAVVEGSGRLGLLGRIERGVSRVCTTARLAARKTPSVYFRDALPGESLADELVRTARARGMSIRTCHRFLQRPRPFVDLVPAPAVRQGVDRHRARLATSVGVHIRRTDNSEAIESSPLEGFVAAMRRELDAAPDTTFFVATDDPASYDELQRRFGAAVFTHPKTSYARSDPRAIVDAAIDLYCLAHCRKLIGSYWSSFSEVAWQLRGIDKFIVRAHAPSPSESH